MSWITKIYEDFVVKILDGYAPDEDKIYDGMEESTSSSSFDEGDYRVSENGIYMVTEEIYYRIIE